MHHGNFPSLRDVIDYYNTGNPAPIRRSIAVDEAMRPVTSPILRKLRLSREERQQLEAFLLAISTSVHKVAAPDLPEE